MTTSHDQHRSTGIPVDPEALREAAGRLTSEADNPTGWKWDLSGPDGIRHDTSVVRCSDLRTLLSALQEAREALRLARDFAEQEIECRGYAGGEMTGYQDEAQKAFDACDAMLSAIEARALSPGGADE